MLLVRVVENVASRRGNANCTYRLLTLGDERPGRVGWIAGSGRGCAGSSPAVVAWSLLDRRGGRARTVRWPVMPTASIRVFCRFRPLNKRELQLGGDDLSGFLRLTDEDINLNGMEKTVSFDRVFGTETDQTTIVRVPIHSAMRHPPLLAAPVTLVPPCAVQRGGRVDGR